MRIESDDEMMLQEAGVRRQVDLAQIGRALSGRRYWVLAPVLFCFVAAVIAVNVIKPRYTAESKILIENQESFFTRPDRAGPDLTPLPDDEAVQSQVQLVSSRDIARDVLKALNLQGNAEFDPIAGGIGPVTRLLVLLGVEPNPLRAAPEDRMLTNYFERLNVYPIAKSRVLSVQFTSLDPDLAAKAANTIADAYIDLQSGAKRDSARDAATSLASLIADLKVKVAAAETRAQEYRAANGLLVGTNNTTIASQQLGDLTTQLAQARTAEADAQAKARILREMIKANRIADVPDVANSDLIRRISEQRITLKAQIAQQAMTLLPGHPRMQELNAQLADIESQMRAAGAKTVRTLENDAHIAAARVENLTSALDGLKVTATTAGTDEVTLRGLEQQASLLKDQLAFNTQKYQEAAARESAMSTPADARVFSRAIAPELPSYPKKLPTVAILTLAGLILSIGYIIASELLSGRAFIADADADADADSPPVSLAPASEAAIGLRPSLHEPLFAATPESETGAIDDTGALKELVSAIAQHDGGQLALRMLVTGADDAVPVLPSALKLARALAEEARVILIDCGAAPDGLGHLITHEVGATVPGLCDLLAGRATFAEVIHRDPNTRLHLVPFGDELAEADTSGDGEDDFGLLIDALVETYDRVVLASPVPAAGKDLRGVDRTDLVVLLRTTHHTLAEIDACRKALHAAGTAAVYTLDVDPSTAADVERTAA